MFHLLTMLFAMIMRFDSLREIETAMTAEVRKLAHLGTVLQRTLSRPWSFSGLASFQSISCLLVILNEIYLPVPASSQSIRRMKANRHIPSAPACHDSLTPNCQ